MLNFTYLRNVWQKLKLINIRKTVGFSVTISARILFVHQAVIIARRLKPRLTRQPRQPSDLPQPDEQPDPAHLDGCEANLKRWFEQHRIFGFSISFLLMVGLTLLGFHADLLALLTYYSSLATVPSPIVLPTPTVTGTALLPPALPSSTPLSATSTPLPTLLPTATPALVATEMHTITPVTAATATPIWHEVEAGEHFSCIAQRYFGSPKYAPTICHYNYELGRIGPDCNALQVGELLKIPTERDSARLPPPLTTPGVRGKDYFCVDGETPVPTLTALHTSILGK